MEITATTIKFPFERNRPYPIGALRAFEATLAAKRQGDAGLGNFIRVPTPSAPAWMRLRNKELVPLRLYADHTRLSDNAEFILRPEGDPVDAQIVAESQTIDLQLTLAAPIWGSADGPQGNSGYQHHQIMSALNSSVVVVGYPPFRDENGIAMGTIDAITGKDRDAACRKGLASALAKKALHDGHGCTLVVFAQEFYMQLLDASALGALVDTVLSEQSMSFDSVCVFDSHPGFFVERAPVRHASRAPESQLDAD